MKLKHLLMKTLFVAVGLCVGQSVWAGVTTVFSQDSWTHVHDGGTGDRSSSLSFSGLSSIDDNWTASFDVITSSTNSRTNGARNYQIALLSASAASFPSNTLATSNVLLGANFVTTNNTDYSSFPCTITVNDAAEAETVTLNHGTKYTFIVSVSGTSLTVSIKNGETSVFSKATTLGAFVKPKGIYDLLPRPYNAGWGVYTSTYSDVLVTKEVESVESFVVNYKSGGTLIASENIDVTGLYCGDSYTVPFRMYVSKDGALYKTTANGSDPYYGDAITLTKNTVVNKSLSAVDLNGGTLELLEDLDDTDGENAGVRASYRSAYNNKAYTSAVTLSPGIYTFIVKAMNKGRGSSVKVGDTTAFTIESVNATKGTWTDKTFTNVAIPAAGNVTLVKGGSNTIDCYDIIIAILHSVPVTITSAGWATFSSDHALDFSSVSSLEAYMITGHEGNVVTKSQVTGTVPAGTGLLLKGDAGSYNIPVAASSSTDVSANLMVAGTGASVSYEAGKTKYILGLNGVDAEFQKLVDGGSSATVAKGKAYLQFNEVISARSLYFEDEVTGIANVEAAAETKANEGKFIDNGKLVIVKNGVKYNVAGAKLY